MPSYVVTGASRGIGWEFLRQLSSNPNNTVIGLVRDKSATQTRVLEELRGPSNIYILQGDLTDYVSLKNAAADTAQITGGGLDYLIANAGLVSLFDAYDPIGVLGQRPEALEAEAMKLFNVNVVGNIHLFNLFVPLVRQGQGKKVIAISSGHAALDLIPKFSLEVGSLYTISKAGLNIAVAKFSAQYAKEGILFMSICPGMVDTGHYANTTPEQMQGLMGMLDSFKEYAPDFKGPSTTQAAVKDVLSVMDKATVENGDGGDGTLSDLIGPVCPRCSRSNPICKEYGIPYTTGRTLVVQPHSPPPPTTVTTNCCLSTPAKREERQHFTPVENCLRNPPLPGRLESGTLPLEILDTIRVGDCHSAQVFTIQAHKEQGLVPHHQPLVAKVYDPLYLDDDGGLVDQFHCVDRFYTHEVRAYQTLAAFQGGLIPRFYGSFSLDIPVEGAGTRAVRLILIEYIPGLSMQQANPSEFPRHVLHLVYEKDILLTDLSPRNAMMVGVDSGSDRELVFIDLADAVFGRIRQDLLRFKKELFRGQYVSPLLRWKTNRPYEFNRQSPNSPPSSSPPRSSPPPDPVANLHQNQGSPTDRYLPALPRHAPQPVKMTRLRGASVSSYEVSRGGIDRPQFHRSKIPPNAPDVIAQNTVDVADPAQVLLWCREERRRQFNLLVRRYKNQLLHGCQDPGCQTTTCASYRRRVTEGPFRRYTELSARTLACYLASVDNAENGLCRNIPRLPHDLSQQENRRSKRRSRVLPPTDAPKERETEGVGHNGEDVIRPSPATRGSSVPDDGSIQIASPGLGLQDQPVAAPEEAPGAQRMRDPKSFSQNLFDTLSLRMIEWLPLRRPTAFGPDPDRLDARLETRIPKTEPEQTPSVVDKPRPQLTRQRTPQHGAAGSAPHTPSSRNAVQPTALELRLPNQQVKRVSLTEVDQWRQGPRSGLEEKSHTELKPARKLAVNTHVNGDEFRNVPSPPALRHRPQKHRGRTGDGTDVQPQTQKKERRVSWDGAKFLNNVQLSDSEKPEVPDGQLRLEAQSPSSSQPNRRSSNQKRMIPTIQSVSHLTGDIIDAFGQMLVLSEEDAEQWRDELDYMEATGNFEDSEGRFASSRQRLVFTFVAQSVFYALSNTRQVLHSFRRTAGPSETSQDSRLDVQQLQPSFRMLYRICPRDIIFHSLWSAAETLFVPPKELSMSGRRSRRSSHNSAAVSTTPIIRRSDSEGNEHFSDAKAADVATVAIFALTSSLSEVLDVPTWRAMLKMRAAGGVASSANLQRLPVPRARLIIGITDTLEHELSLRLLDRLVRALTARLAFHEISKARQVYSRDPPKQRKNGVLDIIVNNLSEQHSAAAATNDPDDPVPGAPALIAEWLRTLFLREWDGNPELSKSSSAGGAVQILSLLYTERSRLGLVPEDFQTPFLADRLEPLDMPVQWIGSIPNNKTMHLLSYPFLFPPSALVIYFRALNYAAMSKHYEAAMTTTRHVTQTGFGPIQIQDDVGLLDHMKTSMSTYLVLVVRRDSILKDALNQLWRRERRELMRPLKVQMGMNEGEEGLDHGGVQQEFFRVLMAEALDTSYGMFTTDGRTRMSWFQPCSWEPLYKFELLGLLMSLAVYNGLTLPVTFPTAFYRKLLGLKVKHLDHIRDGWPELSKGLEDLLAWEEGDVGDIFMRTYEFSFEAFGSVETVDMQKVDKDSPWPTPSTPVRGASGSRSLGYSPPWSEVRRYTDHVDLSPPSSMAAETAGSFGDITKAPDPLAPVQSPTPPADEACMVTNSNRAQFVKDYIFWLTNKSIAPQFEAFTKGFYTCLDRSALSIFTPEALKTVVEGIPTIDIRELERHTRYEGGFSPSHQVIRNFWSIARRYPTEKLAQLLEFVTASDRVPVNGIASIMFVIQKNGVGDARLPTSLTCFGRLLLPEYSSKGVLEEKLNKALENARGLALRDFGSGIGSDWICGHTLLYMHSHTRG
ncbi:hypothetical protein BO70DRAFT_380595 [Aspergillus heteromorphus CBS 117.55]|uniref:HECT-type E3 ubiquitin transferase n=1 Tax=Aspergillus heteromorphus CBS 117.55 TaxID=1448321 RepID=A0A317VYF0_9EURO|nr:uncharacterized protein BO70DRAFT_380595 [Aspergillus heteromorphus CBS 117.55]PWY78361.1 hypothetical protein BO70DRAFT_380595 [Aspergillus heteromorphus CBS 117.55]